MVSYFQRWGNVYTLLKELDDSYTMSKKLGGEMLLERAGLADAQNLLALTLAEQSTNIDKLKPALMSQHAGVRQQSSSYRISTGNAGGKWYRGRFRNNLAHVAEYHDFDYEPDPATPHYEEEAYGIHDSNDADAPDVADPCESIDSYFGASSNAYREDESCRTATDELNTTEDQLDWLDSENEALMIETAEDAFASS